MVTIRRPDTSRYNGPEVDHDTLSHHEAERHLGKRPPEKVHNLGHETTLEHIHEHPLKHKIHDYTSDDVGERHIREGQRPRPGVYGKTANPQSGLSTAENLAEWSRYSSTNSYQSNDAHGGHGEGVASHHADPRPNQRDNPQESDGYLASTDKWANLPDAGGDSGVGRLEKQEKSRR
jgi:hypothetical protein